MPLERIIFTTVFFFAFTLNAITGFAGGIITMPVGIATLGIHNSIAVMNVLGFCASAFIVISGFKHINWKEVRKITLTMVVFLILGIWLINNVPLDFLLRIYGIFIILVGLKNLIQKETIPPSRILQDSSVYPHRSLFPQPHNRQITARE